MPITKSSEKRTKTQKTGWDQAIADAKEKIKKLQFSIKVFREHKKAGEPWPDSATQN